jgi:hypothetical protein
MTRFYAVLVSCIVAVGATVACGATPDQAGEATESSGQAVAACAGLGASCDGTPCCGAPNFCTEAHEYLVCGRGPMRCICSINP